MPHLSCYNNIGFFVVNNDFIDVFASDKIRNEVGILLVGYVSEIYSCHTNYNS